MRIFPTRKQWKNWSLPSKASYFGAIFAIFTFLFSLAFQIFEMKTLISEIRERFSSEEVFSPDWAQLSEARLGEIREDIIPFAEMNKFVTSTGKFWEYP